MVISCARSRTRSLRARTARLRQFGHSTRAQRALENSVIDSTRRAERALDCTVRPTESALANLVISCARSRTRSLRARTARLRQFGHSTRAQRALENSVIDSTRRAERALASYVRSCLRSSKFGHFERAQRSLEKNGHSTRAQRTTEDLVISPTAQRISICLPFAISHLGRRLKHTLGLEDRRSRTVELDGSID